ncbi:YafY family protein [Arthrobacter sp. H35-D1]|uniref:helix-turn-helix transcriptional regulator n=1 Tax=Arthrobacter sp. H35-D1 TaxID=3046202 RepID=UPI0024BB649F|nr:YafY family protein [Arthrobacter sp. H35-D1]MDJ0311813.1 YafY family protein [Arthrobacter sp. H35-D1]
MRADRLVATLLLMQARGRVTAAEVAAELEVSVATSRRDFEALSVAGVPVYPQPGRGGGWSLLGGARTDLTGLTSSEVKAIFLLIGAATALDSAARSALQKLVQALPETFRAQAHAAATALIVDPTPWGETDRPRPERVDQLQAAVVARRKVSLEYENRVHERTRRLVDPWGVVNKDSVWYLVAGTEAGQRTFRIDRIIEATVTELAAERAADFELPREWGLVVDEVERHRSIVSATMLVDIRLLPAFREYFGRHCQELGLDEGGRVQMRVTAQMARSIAEQLAGWGGAVEVLEPEAVKAHLARLGSELVQLYQPTPSRNPTPTAEN